MPTAKKRGRPPAPPLTLSQQQKKDFRAAVGELLEANHHKLAKWLNEVAEGSPQWGRDPDPARALDLLSKLAEFAAPKLGRVEHTGEDGGPLRNVTTIEIEFVDAPQVRALNGNGSHPGITLEAAP